MSFIRTKYIKGIPYLYEVESVRIGGKVVQKHIRYIGAAGGARQELGTTTSVQLGTTTSVQLGTTQGMARRLFSKVKGAFRRRGK